MPYGSCSGNGRAASPQVRGLLPALDPSNAMRRMIRIAHLLDTWVWIEYFDAPDPGIIDLVESADTTYTSIITITEVANVFTRKLSAADARRAIDAIYGLSSIIPVDKAIAIQAGLYSRAEFGGGIADRLILATAEVNNLTVVTGDLHFKGRTGVRFLKRK
jgi:predicted nucleic acid-binding protein